MHTDESGRSSPTDLFLVNCENRSELKIISFFFDCFHLRHSSSDHGGLHTVPAAQCVTSTAIHLFRN